MKKKLLTLIVTLCVMGGFFAVTLPASEPEEFFIGFGPEIGGFTRSGAAFSGGFMAGYGINSDFAVGVRGGFMHDAEDIGSLNMQGFFRYQLPRFLPIDGFFAQANAGFVVFFYRNSSYPAFAGGLSLGWRGDIAENWFIEPAVRFGYPYMWNIAVLAGYSFSPRNND